MREPRSPRQPRDHRSGPVRGHAGNAEEITLLMPVGLAINKDTEAPFEDHPHLFRDMYVGAGMEPFGDRKEEQACPLAEGERSFGIAKVLGLLE